MEGDKREGTTPGNEYTDAADGPRAGFETLIITDPLAGELVSLDTYYLILATKAGTFFDILGKQFL